MSGLPAASAMTGAVASMPPNQSDPSWSSLYKRHRTPPASLLAPTPRRRQLREESAGLRDIYGVPGVVYVIMIVLGSGRASPRFKTQPKAAASSREQVGA